MIFHTIFDSLADDVESVIVNAAARLDRSQVPGHMLGIQFVQVGDDPDATRALQNLDNALANKYNIRVRDKSVCTEHTLMVFSPHLSGHGWYVLNTEICSIASNCTDKCAMTDTTPFNPNNPQFNLEETLFKVLWGGINRQVDHMNEYRKA